MFGLFKKSDEANEKVGPNGHYEGEILCADYAAGHKPSDKFLALVALVGLWFLYQARKK